MRKDNRNKFIKFLDILCLKHFRSGKANSAPLKFVRIFTFPKKYNKKVIVEISVSETSGENDLIDDNMIMFIFKSMLEGAILGDYHIRNITMKSQNISGMIYDINIKINPLNKIFSEIPFDFDSSIKPDEFYQKAETIYNKIDANGGIPLTMTELVYKTQNMSKSLRENILLYLERDQKKIQRRVKPPVGRSKKPTIIFFTTNFESDPLAEYEEFDDQEEI